MRRRKQKTVWDRLFALWRRREVLLRSAAAAGLLLAALAARRPAGQGPTAKRSDP